MYVCERGKGKERERKGEREVEGRRERGYAMKCMLRSEGNFWDQFSPSPMIDLV